MKRIWIATCVNIDNSFIIKPHVIAAASSKEEILKIVRADIEKWANCIPSGFNVYADYDKMFAYYIDDGVYRCEWSIDEIEVPGMS